MTEQTPEIEPEDAEAVEPELSHDVYELTDEDDD